VTKAEKVIDVDGDAPAGEMIQRVLRRRLEEMCGLRSAALDWSDPEGVHKMRVASRRLRSALADFKPYLSRASLPRKRLKAIAGALGAVRDEDVALQALENLEAKVDGKVAQGIAAILAERSRRRLQERAALEQAISKSSIAEFQEAFLARLEAAVGSSGQPSTSKEISLRQVGVEVIGNRLKEIISGSECIYDPMSVKKLHRMRILAKRLRYAVELFAPQWAGEFKPVAKEIARLQTSLGGLHDCDVWIADIGARLRSDMAEDGKNDPCCPEAALWLLTHFVRERTDHYRDALVRWQEWQANNFLANLKSLLRSDEN
jgi:CHAD domain-containing protein